ncbi:MAG: DNA-binding protein [Muribaculaceae bacterium]|nr:DNA-binding protein [Muribaculaceae bacterium]
MPARKTTPDKGFLLRIDPATMTEVERWAAEEFRSVNGQLQWIIAEALRRRRRSSRTRTDQ